MGLSTFGEEVVVVVELSPVGAGRSSSTACEYTPFASFGGTGSEYGEDEDCLSRHQPSHSHGDKTAI
jgi:hypothetical protein